MTDVTLILIASIGLFCTGHYIGGSICAILASIVIRYFTS